MSNKRKIGIIINTSLVIFFFIGLFILQGCSTLPQGDAYLFAYQPKDKTCKPCYPDLVELYASDDRIDLFFFNPVEESRTYILRIQMHTADGLKIYEQQKDLRAVKDENHYLVYDQETIQLDEELKAKLRPGKTTLNFTLDEKLLTSKSFNYIPQKAINPHINKAVILPFSCSAETDIGKTANDQALNTLMDASCGEIKRIVPETTCYDVSDSQFSSLGLQGSFQHASDLSALKNRIDADIYVTGYLHLPRHSDTGFKLVISVYNGKTGAIKEYSVAPVIHTSVYIKDMLKEMAENILFKQGLLSYLREVK